MVKEILYPLFERDLNQLITELESYPSESSIWQVAPGITNSGGTLALHLIGNLNHFIGAVLGNSGYVRNRDAEFNDRNIPRDKMIHDIHETLKNIKEILNQVTVEQLEKDYPRPPLGTPIKTEHFLIYLQSHLNYHLGQINYARRILTCG